MSLRIKREYLEAVHSWNSSRTSSITCPLPSWASTATTAASSSTGISCATSPNAFGPSGSPGAVAYGIRQWFGYERFDDPAPVFLLNDLYRTEWRLYHNFFCSSVELLDKERIGSKTYRRYDRPNTPYQTGPGIQPHPSENQNPPDRPVPCPQSLHAAGVHGNQTEKNLRSLL
jgi:hypothetical protein